MNIRTVENAIIEKLKLSFPEILVEGFPDKPSEFILLHQIGALLVHYQGSNYTSTQALVIKTTYDYKYINKLYDLLIKIRRKSLGTNEKSFKLIVLDWMNQINIRKINKNIALFQKLHPFEKQEDWWKPEVMNSKVSLDYQKNICNFVENIISEDFEIKRYKSVDVNNEDGEY